MSEAVALPSRETLATFFSYDPETGKLFWIRKTNRRTVIGSEAGTLHSKGHIQVALNGQLFKAHRIAWKLMTGDDPGDQIDHANRLGNDNRWSNLREATQVEQNGNTRLSVRNTSGAKGVSWSKTAEKWLVRVGKIRIGYYADFDEAVEARIAAANAYFGSFANETVPDGVRC